MASADPSLSPGTALTVVELGDRQARKTASVVGPATRAGPCARLGTEGTGTVDDEPATFYEVTDWTTEPGSTGIAWTGPPTSISVVDGSATADLEGDGAAETFTVCASSEGLHFAVFSGTAYASEPLWRGYLYLDYDLEPNCPGGFPGRP